MKNVVGLIAAGVATLALLIVVCRMVDVTGNKYNLVVLTATAAGGLCTLTRLLEVLNARGVKKIAYFDEKKKQIAWLITIFVIISGGFGGIALFWYAVALYNLNVSGLMGSSMKTHLLVDMVCLATAAAANLLNFVMGILQIKEADGPPTGPPPS
ncbi:hypothetical protein ACHWQZ_G015383 [Mnemiopsis leidyi]